MMNNQREKQTQRHTICSSNLAFLKVIQFFVMKFQLPEISPSLPKQVLLQVRLFLVSARLKSQQLPEKITSHPSASQLLLHHH